MRKSTVTLFIAALFATAYCWDVTSREKILDEMNVAITGTDVSKATDDYKAVINANTAILEVYDNFLSYNSDYLDRVGESTQDAAFINAETDMQMPKVTTSLPDATYDATSGVAAVKFYYVGNYCYSFNPCVSMKLGYHVEVTFPDPKPTAETFDATAFSQSFAAIKIPQLKSVVGAKLTANTA